MHKRTLTVLFFLFLILPLYARRKPVLDVRYPTGGRVIAAVYDDTYKTFYTLSGDRYLYALDRYGKLLHRTWLKNKPAASLSAGYDHTLYAGSESEKLRAINPAGSIIWEKSLSGIPVGNPVPDPDGTIYAATDSGKLYSVSHTGVIRYRIDLPALPVMAPALNNHGIFIFGNNSRVYLYSREGELVWEFLLSGDALCCALDNDTLYTGTMTGTVVSIDMEGRKRWSTQLNNPVYSLVMNGRENLAAISGASIAALGSRGSIMWKYGGRTPFYSLSAGENILAASDVSGDMNFLDFQGHLLGTVTAGKPSSPVVSGGDGVFVSGSRDWNLYFTKAENNVVSPEVWNGWTGENGGGEGRRSAPGLAERKSCDAAASSPNSYGYLKSMSDLNDATLLKKVLGEIGARISSEEFDRGKSFFLPLLEYIASDCITRPDYRNGELINDFPVIRADAVRILGTYGDFRSRDALLTLLFSEWDDYAVRMIIRALGELGYNPDGETEAGLYRYYQLHSSDYSSKELRPVMLTALEDLNRYNGTLHEDGIHAAVDILRGSSRPSIKEKAFDLLKSIKK